MEAANEQKERSTACPNSTLTLVTVKPLTFHFGKQCDLVSSAKLILCSVFERDNFDVYTGGELKESFDPRPLVVALITTVFLMHLRKCDQTLADVSQRILICEQTAPGHREATRILASWEVLFSVQLNVL